MTFYSRMAETTTRLLTEYGKTITLTRNTTTFNPVTGSQSITDTASVDVIGVEIPIRQELVDGTRIKVGDRFFTLAPDVEPLMTDKIGTASIIAIEPINPAGTPVAYKIQVRQ